MLILLNEHSDVVIHCQVISFFIAKVYPERNKNSPIISKENQLIC